MRLIHYTPGEGTAPPNLTLEEFFGETPRYAILSHRWGSNSEEVSFQDLTLDVVSAKQKKGYRKIESFCTEAQKEGLLYSWVDTCCINKQDSAELSESLNSMYKWYGSAFICYAFLEDIASDLSNQASTPDLSASQWFTRGWTLQELIAPSRVKFYDGNWICLGDQATLADELQSITKVSKDLLLDKTKLKNTSVAQKMSWASRRVTTRLEDQAYSLLGLFDVVIPIIYGEGSKAFLRLQEAIMRNTGDHSIFAWEADEDASDCPRKCYGMLASSPRQFSNSGEYNALTYSEFLDRYEADTDPNTFMADYQNTNRGLRIQLPIVSMSDHFHGLHFAFLACTYGAAAEATIIFLYRYPSMLRGDFMRTKFSGKFLEHHLHSKSMKTKFQTLYLSNGDHLDIPKIELETMTDIFKFNSIPSIDFLATIKQLNTVNKVKFAKYWPRELFTLSGGKAEATLYNGVHISILLKAELSRIAVIFTCGIQENRLWYSRHTTRFKGCNLAKEHSRYDIFAPVEGKWQTPPESLHFQDRIQFPDPQTMLKDAITVVALEAGVILHLDFETAETNGGVPKLTVAISPSLSKSGRRIARLLRRVLPK